MKDPHVEVQVGSAESLVEHILFESVGPHIEGRSEEEIDDLLTTALASMLTGDISKIVPGHTVVPRDPLWN